MSRPTRPHPEGKEHMRHRRFRPSIGPSIGRCGVLLALLVTSTAALSAEAPRDANSWLSDPKQTATDTAQTVGDTLKGWWDSVTGMVTTSNPTGYLPAQISDDDRQFFAVLEAVGLKLKDVTIGKGFFAGAQYQFVVAREPTDADFARAEALLRVYRETADGMRSRAKQRIARSTLDTMATAGFVLSSISISLTPWPDATYQVQARDKVEPPKAEPRGK